MRKFNGVNAAYHCVQTLLWIIYAQKCPRRSELLSLLHEIAEILMEMGDTSD